MQSAGFPNQASPDQFKGWCFPLPLTHTSALLPGLLHKSLQTHNRKMMEEAKAEGQEGWRARQRTRVGLSTHRTGNSRLLWQIPQYSVSPSWECCWFCCLTHWESQYCHITPVPGAGPKLGSWIVTIISEGTGCCGGRALSQSGTRAGKAPGTVTK